MTVHLNERHEGTVWLRGQVAATLARLASLTGREGLGVIVAPLAAPSRPGGREDRTCDRCRCFVPPGRIFYPVAVTARPGVILAGGLCRACIDLECGAPIHD